MADLNKEAELLRKSQRLQKMKAELESKRKEVQKLRGMNVNLKVTSLKSTKPSKQTTISSQVKNESESDDQINICTLRKDKDLKRIVRKELASLGLDHSSSDSLSESSFFSDSSSSDDKEKSQKDRRKKRKSHKKKSGIRAKASDRVKYPQKWPQAHLQYEHVSKQVKYDELDFRLFIAGELEIISEDKLPKDEKVGRLNLLKKIVYYSSTYDFKGLREFYAAWLREIEMGRKSWRDNSNEIESAILSKYVRPQKNYNKGDLKRDKSGKSNAGEDEKVWFCSMYQKNKCSNSTDHLVVVKGKMRMAMHICASCWLKDKKKMQHPESSSACPHINA